MALWSALIARPARTPLLSRPSLTLYFLLAGAFLLTLVPHVLEFPLWLTIAILVSMVLRSVVELYRWPLPSTTFCAIIAIILLGLVFAWFHGLWGREPGTALTAGLLAIKFYEIRAPRDLALIIFSSFFVVMSALLYSQILEIFVYCLIMMWILTALLMRVHTGDMPVDRLLTMLEKSGLIFLQALPLALLLFFFFPRLNGPLGFMLSEPAIGLTDTVTPGSVAKIALDDSAAMFVQFNTENVPPPGLMYWRALVLWHYNNGAWTLGKLPLAPMKPPVEPPARDPGRIGQTITILPNNQPWLYALDSPVSEPINTANIASWGTLYRGHTISLSPGNKLDHMARYTVTSSLFPEQEKLLPDERKEGTQLPTGKDQVNQRVVALADELYQKSAGDEGAYINAVLYYFHHTGFIYTLEPGVQKPDWLTEFLFTRKSGFCEHFAAAFAVLMRIEHIPARLVVGYLGGDYNPYDDAYTVSQANAHAWVEVWRAGKKDDKDLGMWTRYDPTASANSVDPAALTTSGGGQGDGASLLVMPRQPTFADTYFPTWLKDGMREAKLRREQMETNWDTIVLSYDLETQFRLAQAMGFGVNASFKLLMVCLAAVGVGAFLIRQWLARKPSISPVEFLYAAFCRNMARRGIPRAAWEGPFAYTERVAEAFPDDEPALRRVGSIVARVRYGPEPSDSEMTQKLESTLAALSVSPTVAAPEKR
jgi:transglutaminase-like putative cysteine protease